jgi:hypothetical protein
MGAPVPDMNPADDGSADTLLSSLRTIAPAERRKHASVFNYWLSIRRDRQFPPIRDLDPLEISDAGPFSLLLEMIGGGEDAEIRHVGQAIKGGVDVTKVGEAPNPSLLACIATRLPVVAACREAFAFEDSFETADGKTKCWVTLLPFSATGTWIDYVYGFVSLDPAPGAAEQEPEVADESAEAEFEVVVPEADPVEELIPEAVAEADTVMELDEPAEPEAFAEPKIEPTIAGPAESAGKAGFSKKFFESLASGFYGRPTGVELDLESARFETGETEEPVAMEEPVVVDEACEPVAADEPIAADEAQAEDELVDEPLAIEESAAVEEPIPAPTELESPSEPVSIPEGTLQSKLTEVRAKADEARQAKLRANAALYEGLGAAYDFALDAEDAPEEYLRLVEAQGLKIQLRSPMKPVFKLAFDGMCDEATIKQLEAILAWAFDEELPRGTLAERIESEGGIGPILSGQKRAA